MTSFDYETDPRLPPNVVVVRHQDNVFFIEQGRDQEGVRRASVVDMAADHDDDDVTELDYAFRYEDGIWVHDYTGLHRHGPYGMDVNADEHGACEHADPNDQPAPVIVRDIMLDRFDGGPLACPGTGDDP